MCFRYQCRTCQNPSFIYCSSADWNKVNPDCPRLTLDPNPQIKRKKCYTCRTIEGVIKELRALTYQMPWLESEGVAGMEKLVAWELEGLPESMSRLLEQNDNPRKEGTGSGSITTSPVDTDGPGLEKNGQDLNAAKAASEEKALEVKKKEKSQRSTPSWWSDEGTIVCGSADKDLLEAYGGTETDA